MGRPRYKFSLWKSSRILVLCGMFFILIVLSLSIDSQLVQADDAGYALEFDGVTNYVALGDTGDLFLSSTWVSEKTISIWVKPTGLSAPVTAPTTGALILGADRPRLFGITRANYLGVDQIYVWNVDANGIDLIGLPFTLGDWLQITMVHSDGVLSAYKNGELIGIESSGATYVPGGTVDGNLFLGGTGRSDPSLYFQGQIDEVRFWAIALDQGLIRNWSTSEISSVHPNWSDLSSYYKMSDGSSTSLTDDSSNYHPGMLLGGMSDTNWVSSGALAIPGQPTNTPLPPSDTPTPTDTATPTETQSPTEIPPPTATPTVTDPPQPPSDTPTPTDTATPTETQSPTEIPPPTATPTVTDPPQPPSDTPTLTDTATPTETQSPTEIPPPTATPTVTDPPQPPSDTPTPTETNTLVPASNTPAPTNTSIIPTETITSTSHPPTPTDISNGSTTTPTPVPTFQPNLIQVGYYITPGDAYTLEVFNNVAYIADKNRSFQILDVSDPANPIGLSSFVTAGGVYGEALSGNIAYVTNSLMGIRILDVTDPSNPNEISSLSTPGFTWEVTASGDFIYISDRWDGMVIVDVSNPANPFQIGAIVLADQILDVEVAGDYAYAAAYGAGLRVIDISNKSNPVEVGFFNTPGLAYGVFLDGNTLYVADGGSGLWIIDVTDPSKSFVNWRIQH